MRKKLSNILMGYIIERAWVLAPSIGISALPLINSIIWSKLLFFHLLICKTGTITCPLQSCHVNLELIPIKFIKFLMPSRDLINGRCIAV